MFYADGNVTDGVKVRIGIAHSVFQSLRHIWRCKDLPRSLKLSIYKSSTLSVLTYCHTV